MSSMFSFDEYGKPMLKEIGGEKSERKYKGKSLLAFPHDFTVIDTETTGLDPYWDDILEVSAIRVRGNRRADTFSELIHADYVDEFITELTGITIDMVSGAREEKNVLEDFFTFLGDDILVGHNVNFDINFLYDASLNNFGKPFSNNFIDTMRISRRLHPEEKHHRLADLAERYNIDYSHAHRALADCEITWQALQHLETEAILQYGSADEFLKNSQVRQNGFRAKDIKARTDNFDVDNPFYGMVIVFTGTLAKMTRKEAMQLVADIGGINGDSVTAKTNYLVLGTQDYSKVKDGKSGKQKKAEQLKLKGKDIEIISEDVFYSMVGDQS